MAASTTPSAPRQRYVIRKMRSLASSRRFQHGGQNFRIEFGSFWNASCNCEARPHPLQVVNAGCVTIQLSAKSGRRPIAKTVVEFGVATTMAFGYRPFCYVDESVDGSKAAEDCRTPKRDRNLKDPRDLAAASWSAAVFCRFWVRFTAAVSIQIMSNSGRIIFVTGTDTSVGKTVFAASLVYFLRKQGLNALAMKPFCSGSRGDLLVVESALLGASCAAVTLHRLPNWAAHFAEPPCNGRGSRVPG